MKKPQVVPPLRRRFIVPPFSTLNQNAAYWKAENQKWRDRGLKFELPPENYVLDTGQLETFDEPINTIIERLIRQRAHLTNVFAVVPTSVLSARGGFWQKYKRYWIHTLGLHSERGRSEIETTDGNPDRVLGVGLSESQARINASMEKYAKQRRRARKNLGKCFGSGNPGDLSAGFRNAESAKQTAPVSESEKEKP